VTQRDKQNFIVDEREALSAYFNALLTEENILVADKTAVVTEPLVKVVATPEALVAPPVVAPVVIPDERVGEIEAAPEAIAEPKWKEESFQVMLFKVAGLSLAVPLAELNGVQEWDEAIVTPMPGHAPWYLGLVNYRDKQVAIIDTARFVMPEDRQGKLAEEVNERLNRIVYIGDASWGLACDEVAEVITISPEQVRWRSNRTSRRWLAGTVLEQMCALIDPPVFAEMLEKGMGLEDLGV